MDASVFMYSNEHRQSHCFFLHTVTTESLKPDLDDFVSTSHSSGLSPNPLRPPVSNTWTRAAPTSAFLIANHLLPAVVG